MVMRVVCIPHTDNDVKGSGMEWQRNGMDPSSISNLRALRAAEWNGFPLNL